MPTKGLGTFGVRGPPRRIGDLLQPSTNLIVGLLRADDVGQRLVGVGLLGTGGSRVGRPEPWRARGVRPTTGSAECGFRPHNLRFHSLKSADTMKL